MIEVKAMATEEMGVLLERNNYGHSNCARDDHPYVVSMHYNPDRAGRVRSEKASAVAHVLTSGGGFGGVVAAAQLTANARAGAADHARLALA